MNCVLRLLILTTLKFNALNKKNTYMKKLILSISVAALLVSCGPDANVKTNAEAKGGVYYGGVFRMNEVENFKNLYPLAIDEVISQRIANQIYEGLVKLKQSDLSVVPAVAYKWESNADASQWTFHLRPDVYFHDDACFADGKGRKVTAQDFKNCFDLLCTESGVNTSYNISFKDRVIGANAYYESTVAKKPLAGGVEGVKALNDSTLQINLTHSFSGFLNILALPGCYVYPKEALDKYGLDMRSHCVGTGPFAVKTIKENEVVILERNPKYYMIDEFGNQLPYLDIVKFSFTKEKKSELQEFQKGNLEMIFRLPVEMHKEIMGNLQDAKSHNTWEYQSVSALATNYYAMFIPSQVFNKKEVRLALNYAIDRQKIVDYTLNGSGVPGFNGIIPPVEAFEKSGLDFKSMKGYSYDLAKAKELLKQAGYPDGKGLPVITLTINAGGNERNGLIAEAIQSDLKKNLGVEIKIDPMPFAEQIVAYQSGKLDFWRMGWIADYPDPETFLNNFYGKNVPANPADKAFNNPSRYKNAQFDSVFAAALTEVDITKRFALYQRADQILLDDGAFMPIFYDENERLVQSYVRNFPANPMEYRDLTSTYIIPVDKRAKEAKK